MSARANLLNGKTPRAELVRAAELNVELAKDSLWSTQASRDATCARGASLSCDAANASTEAQEAAVKSAETNLARVKAGGRPEDIAAAESAVTAAEARVASAQALAELARTGQIGGAVSNTAKTRAAEATVRTAEAQVLVARAYLTQLTVPRSEDVSIAESEVDRATHALRWAQLNREAACGRSSASTAQCDGLKASEASADTALRAAENQLARVKAGGRPEEVAAAEAGLSAVEAQLASAQAIQSAVANGSSSDDLFLAEVAVDHAAGRLSNALLAMLRGR
jgi:hypothetical protein